MPSTTLGRGNILASSILGPTLTPVAVAGSTAAEQSFTIAGLQTSFFVNLISQGAQTAGIGIVNVRVSATNTLTVEFSNSTAGTLTPVAGVYLMCVDDPEPDILPVNLA